MTERENCEVLFGYLESILYDNTPKELDIEVLDEPYRDLGKGMQLLHRSILEMKRYSHDLPIGELPGEEPGRENSLCSELKTRKAEGGYSEHAGCPGGLSGVFHAMIEQLRKRESHLKEQMQTERKRAEMFERYNDLVMDMLWELNEWMVVVDAETKEILYSTDYNTDQLQDVLVEKNVRKETKPDFEFLKHKVCDRQVIWEQDTLDGQFYRITSCATMWYGRHSYVHVMQNITEDKIKAKNLTSIAYRDSGTGVFNRRYFEEHMKQVMKDGEEVTLCYMDLDRLKYVNDRFGHNQGDIYIQDFVAMIQRSFRNDDILCRLGGDEFCLILASCKKDVTIQKAAAVLESFVKENKKPYPVSFSYGIVEVHNYDTSLKEILNKADQEMYKCKRMNRLRFPRPEL